MNERERESETKPGPGRSVTHFLLLVLVLWEQMLKINHSGILFALSKGMQSVLHTLGRALCK